MEYRRRCNVCGKIYCYSDKDLSENTSNSAMAAISAIGGLASIFGGTRLDTYALNSQTDRYSSKVVGYNKCPSCNSTNTSLITDTEWLEMQQKETAAVQTQVIQTKKIDINSNATSDSLLKRTKMFLEEEDWDSASAYCEQILDIDPECAMAYVYKLMTELKVTEQDKLALLAEPFTEEKLYQKAIRFADGSLRSTLEGYNHAIIERNNERAYSSALTAYNAAKTEQDFIALIPRFKALEDYKNSMQMVHECEEKATLCKYTHAVQLQQRAKTEKEFLEAKAEFDSISSYSDARTLSVVCRDKAEEARKNAIYDEAVSSAVSFTIMTVENAIKEFEKIPGWRDADQKKIEALNRVDQLEKAKKKAANKKKITGVLIVSTIIICVVSIIIINEIQKRKKYNLAESYVAECRYQDAINVYTELGEYKDSIEKVERLNYEEAIKSYNEGDYAKALSMFKECNGYSDANKNIAIIELYYEIKSWNSSQIYCVDFNDILQDADSCVTFELIKTLDVIKKLEKLNGDWQEEGKEYTYYTISWGHRTKNGEKGGWSMYYGINGTIYWFDYKSGDDDAVYTLKNITSNSFVVHHWYVKGVLKGYTSDVKYYRK